MKKAAAALGDLAIKSKLKEGHPPIAMIPKPSSPLFCNDLSFWRKGIPYPNKQFAMNLYKIKI